MAGARSRCSRREEPSGETGHSAGSLRDLPRWIKVYLYGMHGVSLDVLLSSLQGVSDHRDPKLLGFSSPYLCLVHALNHFLLEKVYAQKSSFGGRPAVFHLVFYPSIYIGLQLLIGSLSTLPEQVRVVSGSQLVVHYLLALYFTQVFHRWVSRLRYSSSGTPDLRSPGDRGDKRPHAPEGLPGLVRFLFFGMQGLLDEVIFTAIFHLVEKSDRSLSGHTSPWSFLMYGSCSFVVEKLYLHLRFRRGWRTWQRLPIYVCFIYTWEFCWGLFLRQFNACSWDYSHYPYNVMGLITLLYLPGWVGLSLYQDVLSNVLMRIKVCPKDGNDLGEESKEVNGELDSKNK
ncbi:transmembrane protein 229A [Limanda limanda]|uniref:transmembrane protein 229A n=1 Tax=Limanda limanda TaxID=27771 RepID=UPI0029C95E03|nr:transmembrane protein 229A [Limanda limanda]